MSKNNSMRKSGLRQNISKHMYWSIPRTTEQIIRPRPLMVPSRFNQRGIIIASMISKRGPFVKLTNWGQLFADNGSGGGGNCTASVDFEVDDDGGIELQLVATSPSGSIPVDEWWTGQPNTTITDDFDVRTSTYTGTFDNEPVAEGVWMVPMSNGGNGQKWLMQQIDKESPSDVSVTAVAFQIRTNVGQVIVASNSGVSLRCRN